MADGVSVLQAMTAGVEAMAARAPKAPKGTLTALPTEQVAGTVLPNDVGVFMSNERMRDHAKALREMAAELTQIADGLDERSGFTTTEDTTVADPKAAQKERERAADAQHAGSKKDRMAALAAGDEEFPARMARLKAEAQAATFTPDVPETPEVPPEVEQPAEVEQCQHGWTCPTHGTWQEKTSPRRNRQYHGCATEGCKEFEKL